MSTLVTQLYLLEKYGPRLTTEQLAERREQAEEAQGRVHARSAVSS